MRWKKLLLALLALYALSFGFAAGLAFTIWSQFDDLERVFVWDVLSEQASLFLFAGLFLLAILSFLVHLQFVRYVIAPLRIAEQTRFIASGNPAHRIEPRGAQEVRELAGAVNALADQHEALRRDVESRIDEAQAKLGEERDRLAAIISEATQGVLVCNVEGRILLYNRRARQLLGQSPEGPMIAAGASLVGLGRSVFAIFERSLIAHALETLQDQLAKGTAAPAASFVTSAPAEQLVRVQATPVLRGGRGGSAFVDDRRNERDETITGFVLRIDDVTKAMEAGSRQDVVLRTFTDATRRALASIRAAVETLLSFRDMEPEKQAKFLDVIGQEASALSETLHRTASEHAASLGAEWLREEMLGSDLVAAAARRIRSRLGIDVAAEEVDPSLWLKVDSYALVRALTSLAIRLRDPHGAAEIGLRLRAAGRLAHLDLVWSGAEVPGEAVAAFETSPLDAPGEPFPATLKEVIERHGGEVWHQVARGTRAGFLRLALPSTRAEPAALQFGAAWAARPEYYDFDLFHQAGQTPELDQRPLAELTFTAFDTETTGLHPSEGDEIISVGAVRIVNGRVLHHESFEQLVDPRRPVSLDTVRITGIDPATLAGQPTIEKVLPPFHRFCEETVLVAHNAAFDLRFLQIKEERSGVRFTQPVLDTMLLGAVIQPTEGPSSLDTIARRFGVAVIGRHTALGDAIMTGEIFLKMIPLLTERGIVTLGDAREASERTFHARVRY